MLKNGLDRKDVIFVIVFRIMDARGKFGDYERSVRVARGAAKSNSSFLSTLQTSQVHPYSIYAQLKA